MATGNLARVDKGSGKWHLFIDDFGLLIGQHGSKSCCCYQPSCCDQEDTVSLNSCHEFSVRYVTTYAANRFPPPSLLIYSILHKSKTTFSECKKKKKKRGFFFLISVFSGCNTPKYSQKQGDGKS